MNKLRADAVAFAHTLRGSAVANTASSHTFVLLPLPCFAEVADIPKDTRVKVGAQSMHGKSRAPCARRAQLDRVCYVNGSAHCKILEIVVGDLLEPDHI